MTNKLTPRQTVILYLVSFGWRNKEIAQELHISTIGVQSHLQNIYARLNAANRTDATIKAHKKGYIDLLRYK